jgi:hypothetical protein
MRRRVKRRLRTLSPVITAAQHPPGPHARTRTSCQATILATTAVGALAQEQTPLHKAAMRNHPALTSAPSSTRQLTIAG